MNQARCATSPDSLHVGTWPSPIGLLLIAVSNTALHGIWFADQKDIPSWVPAPQNAVSEPMYNMVVEQLDEYFAAQRLRFELPVDMSHGTPFQQAVWQALSTIEYGHTCSYASIAKAVGKPKAVRAVGGAVGRNPLGIVLPCHRVLGAGGALTGYTGGLPRKQALLTLEQQHCSRA